MENISAGNDKSETMSKLIWGNIRNKPTLYRSHFIFSEHEENLKWLQFKSEPK